MAGENKNNKQQSKIRLVKCPRCAKLLPEPEHVPLYTCGGCGTTLKAKYYKGHLKDIKPSSRGRDFTKSNGTIHAHNNGESSSSSRRSRSGEHAAPQEKGTDQDAIETSRNSEQDGAVNSSNDSSLSNESSFFRDKENGGIENKLEKDIDDGKAEDAVKNCSNSEQNGVPSSSHHIALSEDSSFSEKKEVEEIDQLNSKDQVSNGFLDVHEKKEPEQHTAEKSATEDLNIQDELQEDIAVDNRLQKQIRDVNIGSTETCAPKDSEVLEKKDLQKLDIARESIEGEGEQPELKQIGFAASSSLAESSGITELDSSVHAVSNEIRNMHLNEEHLAEQKHMGSVNSPEDSSSLTVPSDIKKSQRTDDVGQEVSEKTKEMHLVGKHHQNELNQVEYANSAKEASSLLESSAIKNPTQSSMHVVSSETRKLCIVEKHSHQSEQNQTECVNSSEDSSPVIVSTAIENPAGPDVSDDEVSEEAREEHLVRRRFHHDLNEQNHVSCVNSVNDVVSLSKSSKNPAKYFDEVVSKETSKIHLGGEHLYQDQHGQKQTEYVNSSNEASSLTVSSAIENLVRPDASDYEVSEETRKAHLVGKECQQDQNEQKQDPVKESSAKEKLAQLAYENSAEDASDSEVSRISRKMHLWGKNSQQDISGSEIDRLDEDEPEEVENSGKEFGYGREPNNFINCIVERHGNVKPSSEASLSTDITQGGKDCVSVPSNGEIRNSSIKMDPTKVSRDSRNESMLDNGKRASKQNVNKPRDVAVYTNTEVGSSLKEVPRYFTKKSPAYDGSVSSFDDNDDQVAEHPAQVVEETVSRVNAVAGYDGAEESLEWTNHMLDGMMCKRTSRVQLDKKKSSMAEERGLPEENEIPQKVDRYRPYTASFLSRVPNRRRNSDMAFETGSSSSYTLHDEFPSHQMHHPPYRRRFPEVPRWREKEFHPAYYNYETSGEIYDRPKHHAYVDGRRQTESWSQSGALPRRPYSGEIFNGRYPCMHHYPDDRRWSAQLPPPAACCHQGAYMGPSWETRWDPYDSYATSPQRFVDSESSYAWGHDTVSLSDDQRHKDLIMRRLYLREKRQALKRQFHPTAGGAPFISCYSCFNILQLPEDFLISKSRRRRTHKLQCGACSSVLEFSLENESGLARRETNIARNANQAVPSSHVNHSCHSSLNSMDGRELLSRDSSEASSRAQRKFVHGSSRRGETMEGVHDDDAAHDRGRSAKVSWQLPARSKSPLHRLMGYSSPQDLLSLHEADDLK